MCTLGRLSLKGLLTRNSTKQNPSDHASALYYNMLCAVKFVVPFFAFLSFSIFDVRLLWSFFLVYYYYSLSYILWRAFLILNCFA